MKKGSTLFLKVVILLIAVGALFALLWFPPSEGRAAGLDLVSIYLDPVIMYMYIASVAFFAGLYQAFTLLNLIDRNKAFSQEAVNKLRNIKLASLILAGFVIAGIIYLRLFAHGDDPAGPTMLGAFMSLAFGVIATAAGVFQKLLQNAVDIKSENDLTV